jgi:hypothetical protein
MLKNFDNWLVEINMSQAKKATEIFLSSGGKKRYEEIFNGQDRIYYDFKTKQEITSPIMIQVGEALEKEGYIILDYIQGLCYAKNDPKRNLKIQKTLFKMGLESLAQKMNTDPIRDSSKTTGMKVVFSRHGIDLAGQSTDRDWTSCKHLTTGMNAHYVWKEIAVGSIVAYLINAKDLNIQKPIARLTLGVFRPESELADSNQKTVALFPTSSVYGNYRDPSFYNFVIDWCVEANKKINVLPGKYFLDPSCHADTHRELKVYGNTSLSDYIEKLLNRGSYGRAELNIKKQELDLESSLDIFDVISKMNPDDVLKVLDRLDIESEILAGMLEKGDIKDIDRMQNEHSTSLGTFLRLSEPHWKKISAKRKRELYDIYESILGKETLEEILSQTTTSASRFLKIEHKEKYK